VLGFLQHALSQVPVKGTADHQFTDWPLNQIPIAAKTGTAEVAGKQTTSGFATYAPASKPQYAVVMMVSQGGFGSTTSADSVKAVYRELFGVHGKSIDPRTSVLPNAVVPVKLPVTTPDGRILPPGSVVPRSTATPTPSGPTSPSSPAPPGSGGASTPAALPVTPPVFGSSERARPRAGGP